MLCSLVRLLSHSHMLHWQHWHTGCWVNRLTLAMLLIFPTSEMNFPSGICAEVYFLHSLEGCHQVTSKLRLSCTTRGANHLDPKMYYSHAFLVWNKAKSPLPNKSLNREQRSPWPLWRPARLSGEGCCPSQGKGCLYLAPPCWQWLHPAQVSISWCRDVAGPLPDWGKGMTVEHNASPC